MVSVPLFFYFGIFLAIEVASVGVCLVLLCYNHVLALLTLLATTVIITLILFRAIIRLEEMGADV